jgi:hypothetical protein
VLLTASDNSDPATNGRTYTLALDADRTCKDAVWTYPGDTLQIVLDPVGALPQGATAIDLTGMAFVSDPGDRSVAVRVEADGVQVYKDNVLIRALAEVTQLPLSPPIRAGVKAVKVTIDAPADGPYILFIGASLVAPEAEPLVRAVAAPEATPAAPAAPAPTGGTLEFDLTSPRVDPKNLMQLIKLDAAPEDSVVAAAAMSTGKPGLRFEAKAAASSRLCTGRFVVRGAGTARVHANPVSVPPSPNKAAGLRFEVTYFGEDKQPLRVDGKIVSVGVPLPTSGGWAWTDLDVSPPAGAAQAQLCVRFAKSTGVVELDGMTAQGEPLGK